ncbi:MAG: cold-shock protein [Gammaproteobacteria bacterium HGW-Gammaproteobacteria-14]|nr:MAG: cold-shock protein [Gammaproteobacteria bacterium HGW-Gammaproteobacteria-14]
MHLFFTLFHILFALAFAAFGITAIVAPEAITGQQPANDALLGWRLAGTGLLFAATVSLLAAFSQTYRKALSVLLFLYLAILSVAYASAAEAHWWVWLPAVVALLPFVSLLPTSRLSLPLKEGELEGEVKWFNPNKGFGFILSEDGQEIFVHFKALTNGGRRSLRQGQQVRFRIRQSERGDQADQVRIIE